MAEGSLLGRFRQCVEIPILLAFFSFFLCVPVDTNFIIYRTCYTSLGYSKLDCEKLGSKDYRNETQGLEKLVQPYANLVMMTQSLLTGLIPAVTYLFIGPWSDRNGRKPVMKFAIAGFFLRGLVTLIVVLIESLPPWYLLIGSVPSSIFGNIPQMMIAMICYVIDATDEERRGIRCVYKKIILDEQARVKFRIGFLEAVPIMGMFLGTFCSSYVFSSGGYTLVYGVDVVCQLLAFVYVVFVLYEDYPIRNNQDEASIFSFENITEILRATFKVRPAYGRCILLITLLTSVICVLIGRGDGSVIFQYFRQKLHWDLDHYTLYSSITTLAGFLVICASVALLYKLLKIPELPLMTIGILSYLASSLVQGLSSKDWHIYFAGGLKCLYGIFNPMFRSFVSKLISKEETGKVFSAAVTVDSLVVLIGSPLYTLIYNHTINTNPGMFNFMTAGFCAFNLVLITIVIVIRKMLASNNSEDCTILAEEPKEIV